MQEFNLPMRNKQTILALGAESAGNFSVFKDGTVHFSQDFGNLMIDANFHEFTRNLSRFLKDKKIRPDVILSDLHPLFHTTLLAQELAKKYKAEYVPVQHHLAHVFSSVGDRIIQNSKFKIQNSFLGIACDGTGFGFDEKIWGGEIFKFEVNKLMPGKLEATRVGHLENQILIGGEMAIKEPARLIISIINKFPISNLQFTLKSQFPNIKNKKELAYNLVKKHYTKNEFEVLWNQLEQNFNCLETSSTARVLDAVSVLLGFSENERLSKHGPVELLEKNSTKPYTDLKPKIERYKIQNTRYKQVSNSNIQNSEEMLVLNTTYLFEYLIKNLHKDKRRLAATAQKYIADGLLEINNEFIHNTSYKIHNTFFSGGMANNKIISSLLESKGIYTNKKIPRGDAGVSFGQIFYYLLSK